VENKNNSFGAKYLEIHFNLQRTLNRIKESGFSAISWEDQKKLKGYKNNWKKLNCKYQNEFFKYQNEFFKYQNEFFLNKYTIEELLNQTSSLVNKVDKFFVQKRQEIIKRKEHKKKPKNKITREENIYEMDFYELLHELNKDCCENCCIYCLS